MYIVVEIISLLSIEYDLKTALNIIKEIPTKLTDKPYKYVIWNPDTSNMIVTGKTLARDKLMIDLGLITSKTKITKINKKYAAILRGF